MYQEVGVGEGVGPGSSPPEGLTSVINPGPRQPGKKAIIRNITVIEKMVFLFIFTTLHSLLGCILFHQYRRLKQVMTLKGQRKNLRNQMKPSRLKRYSSFLY